MADADHARAGTSLADLQLPRASPAGAEAGRSPCNRLGRRMNLNTITEVKRPASADQITQLARRICLARRRHLAVLRAAGRDRHAHRSRGAGLAGAGGIGRRPRHRRDLPHRRALPVRRRPPDWRAAPLLRECCRRAAGFVQDPERRDGRRQHLHVAAGRRDDLAHRRARRHLHAVAARRARRARCRRSTSSPATTPTCCGRANCCAASTCRRRRCRSVSPSAAPRSPSSAARRRC